MNTTNDTSDPEQTLPNGHEARRFRRLLQTETQSFPADTANRLTAALQSLSRIMPRQTGSEADVWETAKELREIAATSPPVMEFYVKLLQELPGYSPTTSQVCQGVIEAFGLLGQKLDRLLVPVTEALAAHLKCVPSEATESLRRLSWAHPEAVQQALYGQLIKSPWLWDQAAWLLREMLPGRVNVTGQWLESDYPGVRAAGIVYSAMINPSHEAVVNMVKDAMVDPNELIRCAAVEGAFHLPTHADVRALLLHAMHAPERSVLLICAQNIRANAPWCAALLPELFEVLRQHEFSLLRANVARGLGLLGEGGVSAIPALMIAANDCDRSVRSAAKGAIERIVSCSTR
jgi:hypothetical protein